MYLSGAPDLLELPLSSERPSVQQGAAKGVPLHLSKQLSTNLVSVCERCDATLNSVLLAAWGALLHHLSRQKDIIIGLTHSMRCEQPSFVTSTHQHHLTITTRCEQPSFVTPTHQHHLTITTRCEQPSFVTPAHAHQHHFTITTRARTPACAPTRTNAHPRSPRALTHTHTGLNDTPVLSTCAEMV